MEEIRVMTKEDLDFAVHVTHQEGWGYNKEDLQRILDWSPDGCFVLWSEGHRIGIATTMFYGTFGWIGNVVITKDLRGRGHGRAIVEKCMTHILGRGARGVRLFAYENTKAFYEGMNYRHDGPVRVHRRNPAELDWGGPQRGHTIAPLDGEGLEAALELDLATFGGDRGYILRAIHRAEPGICLGLWKDDEIKGAIFAKRVLGNLEIGPWMCDLLDTGPGLDLLDSILSKNNTSVFLGVPERHGNILSELEKRGFKTVDKVFGMSFGRPPLMNTDALLSVGALEKG